MEVLIPKLNPFNFHQKDAGLVIDNSTFAQLASWEEKVEYAVPYQSGDNLYIQFKISKPTDGEIITQGFYLCSAKDDSELYSYAFTLQVNSIADNYNYYEYGNSVNLQPGLNDGDFFYFKLIVNSDADDFPLELHSENIQIKSDWDNYNTVVISCQHYQNDFDVCFLPADTILRTFYTRVEGGFDKTKKMMYAKETIFEDEPSNFTTVASIPYPSEKLTIGDAYGVPNWVAELVSNMMSCSSFFVTDPLNVIIDFTTGIISPIQYTKYNNAKWERTVVDKLYSQSTWEIELVESTKTYSKTYRA